jgi:hypothetical protein
MIHLSKIWLLFFICRFLTFMHWKSKAILHHKLNDPCFKFSWTIWMNELCSSLSLRRFMVTIFVSNGMSSYLLIFLIFAFTFSIKTLFMLSHNWVKFDNSANISYFFYSTTDIKNNFGDMKPIHPSITSSINNHKTRCVGTTRMSAPWILERLANVSPFLNSLSNRLRITNEFQSWSVTYDYTLSYQTSKSISQIIVK